MTARILLIQGPNQEQRVPLDKERCLIGRDPQADLRLEGVGVSRQHAVILNKFGTLYIENLSSTGEVKKNGIETEVAEFTLGDVIEIGPYKISLTEEKLEDLASIDKIPADPPIESFSTPEAEAPAHAAAEVPAEDAPQDPFNDIVKDEASQPSSDQLNVSDLLADSVPNEKIEKSAPSLAADAGGAVVPSTVGTETGQASTRVSGPEVKAILRVTRGEELGREIKLDQGSSWTVGRGPKNDIQIHDAKLSRQHFQIIKMGGAYRLQDLGSANGTRINGVNTSDSPLNSFDSIQAGPVELQFIVAEAALVQTPGALSAAIPYPSGPASAPAMAPNMMPNMESLESLSLAGQSPDHTRGAVAIGKAPPTAAAPQMSGSPSATQVFQPPVPFSQGLGQGATQARSTLGLTSGAAAFGSSPQSAPQPAMSAAKSNQSWLSRQSPATRILLILLVFGGVGYGLYSTELDSSIPPPASSEATATVPTPESTRLPASDQASQEPSSGEFESLPADRQQQIVDLYAQAEKAMVEKDWQTVVAATREIVNSIPKYRKSTEMLAEAQTQLSVEAAANIKPKELADARDAASEEVQVLLDNGMKAIADGRFEDAESSCSKAINIEPSNEMVVQCLAQATARTNKAIKMDVPNAPLQFDEALASKLSEAEGQLESFTNRHAEARKKNNMGEFGAALQLLKDLDAEMESAMMDYTDGRAPAAVASSFETPLRSLRSRVREGIDMAKVNLKSEYQSKLADAMEFISNRQYTEARRIYDEIINNEPAFEEVVAARRMLYERVFLEAKSIYQEGLVYESVGDIALAVESFQKAKEFLTGVEETKAKDYLRRSLEKLRKLKR